MSGYGKKGGTSVTAGRKAEMLTATGADGTVYRKLVFFGQRYLIVSHPWAARHKGPVVTTWATEEVAEQHANQTRALREIGSGLPSYPLVEVLAATVVPRKQSKCIYGRAKKEF